MSDILAEFKRLQPQPEVKSTKKSKQKERTKHLPILPKQKQESQDILVEASNYNARDIFYFWRNLADENTNVYTTFTKTADIEVTCNYLLVVEHLDTVKVLAMLEFIYLSGQTYIKKFSLDIFRTPILKKISTDTDLWVRDEYVDVPVSKHDKSNCNPNESFDIEPFSWGENGSESIVPNLSEVSFDVDEVRPRRKVLQKANLIRKGVPNSYHNLTVEDLDSFGIKAREVALDYIQDYILTLSSRFALNQGIFIYGSNGVGKSLIASLIVKEAYACRYTSRRVTLATYIKEHTDTWNIKDPHAFEEAQGNFYHNYKAVEFLVIEEIGKELETRLVPTLLEDLLRYREERSLVTIICTNMRPIELKARYGNSIYSLIKGNMLPLRLVGNDQRC